MRASETWRDRCAHSPECQTESDCNAADVRDASNGATEVAEEINMPKPKKKPDVDVLKDDNAALRGRVDSLNRELEEVSARLYEVTHHEATRAHESKAREAGAAAMLGLIRARTFAAYAAAAADLGKLGGFPAIESLSRATVNELTVISREMAAQRIASVTGVADQVPAQVTP